MHFAQMLTDIRALQNIASLTASRRPWGRAQAQAHAQLQNHSES